MKEGLGKIWGFKSRRQKLGKTQKRMGEDQGKNERESLGNFLKKYPRTAEEKKGISKEKERETRDFLERARRGIRKDLGCR